MKNLRVTIITTKKFDEFEFNSKLIYRIPHIDTYETKTRIFQCKLLNNVLYYNKNIFHFGIISQSKRSFCELYDKTPQLLFINVLIYTIMEPTLIISFRKSCITSFNSTEWHLWLYWFFRPELLFSRSFASDIQIHRVQTLSSQSLKYVKIC